jgi:hypothetical protein
MKQPIDKLRKIFEEHQTLKELAQFVETNEKDRLEKDWKEFVNKVVNPAFDKIKREVFKEMFSDLPEKIAEPGFKVKDFKNSEFWFWIELQGGLPKAQARRKNLQSARVSGVATLPLNSELNFSFADVTEDDVISAITYSYEKSFFRG